MKALSVRQPWAGLIAAGLKTIEVRPRPTHYRGDLLICCANLLPDRDGGPLRVFLPGIRARTAAWLRYPETDVQTVTIRDGLLDLPACPRFAAVRVTL